MLSFFLKTVFLLLPPGYACYFLEYVDGPGAPRMTPPAVPVPIWVQPSHLYFILTSKSLSGFKGASLGFFGDIRLPSP